MYDYPHTRAANTLLWSLIREQLGYGPAELTHNSDPWDIWQSPDLVFSQTCGLPFRAGLHDKVQLIGTPDYGLVGCPTGHYNSVIVVSSASTIGDVKSLKGQSMAYNEGLSQSGWAAPQAHLKQANVSFETGPCTGSHKASAQAVATGGADFAAIDALTWEMLRVNIPEVTDKIRVLDRTLPTPALPYITSMPQDAGTIANAVESAIKSLPTAARETLHLKGLVRLSPSAYLEMPLPTAP
jgi:ABC-type phosphate/phosphonate transport system substrate-binding protein